ncbi:hypothetical protein LCGC14_0358930 [marine sediment metagenome]|uniref:Uncharacterized protein n=1 Tax=marine sediment metagenome TaxID=412755 RepID=A0A0F9WGV1_9ZZZZ
MESGIDYRITRECKRIRYLQAQMRCEICDEPVNEQGSDITRPHMHHYFFGAVPWELRHNPAYFVCLCYKCHKVNVDAPHENNHDFRRRYHLKLERVNRPRLFVLKAAEGHHKRGEISNRQPSKDEKKALLRQLKRESKLLDDTTIFDLECQQTDPRINI